MDGFEWNKIAGAVLATGLVLVALNIAADAIFAPRPPSKPGYAIDVPGQPSAQAKREAAEEPFGKLLASADVARGESAAKKCAPCHTFQKGGSSLVGPNLWGVVNRAKASVAGFNYSAALKGKGGNWTLEELNAFLQNPKAAVPGTSMNFVGVTKGSERADLLAFLNARSDNPAPLPKAEASAPPAGGK